MTPERKAELRDFFCEPIILSSHEKAHECLDEIDRLEAELAEVTADLADRLAPTIFLIENRDTATRKMFNDELARLQSLGGQR